LKPVTKISLCTVLNELDFKKERCFLLETYRSIKYFI